MRLCTLRADRFPILFGHCRLQVAQEHCVLLVDRVRAFWNRHTRVTPITPSAGRAGWGARNHHRAWGSRLQTNRSFQHGAWEARHCRALPTPATTSIWKNAAPARVQIFIRLLTQRRIRCRSNLHRKKIMDSDLWSTWPGGRNCCTHYQWGLVQFGGENPPQSYMYMQGT
jgi:hypothetical protein